MLRSLRVAESQSLGVVLAEVGVAHILEGYIDFLAACIDVYGGRVERVEVMQATDMDMPLDCKGHLLLLLKQTMKTLWLRAPGVFDRSKIVEEGFETKLEYLEAASSVGRCQVVMVISKNMEVISVGIWKHTGQWTLAQVQDVSFPV